MQFNLYNESEKFLKTFEDILKRLDKKYPDFQYYLGSKEIFNLEHFYIFLFIIYYKPYLIFESGYLRGRTSLILLESLREFNIPCQYYVANAHKRSKVYFTGDYDNFNLLIGLTPAVIDQITEKKVKTFAIIDGPKFKRKKLAYDTYDILFSKFDILGIFQHDIGKIPDSTNYINYYNNKKRLRKRYSNTPITECFINKYSFLDKEKPKKNLGLFIKKD